MRYFNVYSIDTKIHPIDGNFNRASLYMGLQKRTEQPVSLMTAQKIGVELNKQGHVVELRVGDSKDEGGVDARDSV